MTPEEWDRCADPQELLKWLTSQGRGRLRRTAAGRRLRLFACACCRRAWRFLDATCRQAVELCERFADGGAGQEELDAAEEAARERWHHYGGLATGGFDDTGRRINERRVTLRYDAAAAATSACLPHASVGAAAAGAALHAVRVHAADVAWNADAYHRAANRRPPLRGVDDEHVAARAEERAAQCHLLRDIFGGPFHPPPAITDQVLTYNRGAAHRLAESVYAGRRFGDLPVLADLLEEAGLTDAALLGHLRGPGPHVLGCWALDAAVGRP